MPKNTFSKDKILSVVPLESACQGSLMVMQIQCYLEKQQEGAADDEDKVREDHNNASLQPAAKNK